MDVSARRFRLPTLRRRPRPARLEALIADTRPVVPDPRRSAVEGSARWFDRERELERECAEVSASILLVAGGRISGTVVCGLHQARIVREALRGLAADLGVDVFLLDRADGGQDLAVRPH
ncbi:MAG TPA: hypothetical protein VEY67_05270 [Candidatus Dormibacteraeota bacterium]|nr:hypothetical protein [Candidatus Dormibacteraeota bacterium]